MACGPVRTFENVTLPLLSVVRRLELSSMTSAFLIVVPKWSRTSMVSGTTLTDLFTGFSEVLGATAVESFVVLLVEPVV